MDRYPLRPVLNQNTRIIDLNCGDIKELIDGIISEKLNELVKTLNLSSSVTSELWTRKQTAQHLHITLPTLRAWTKSGLLKGHEMGGRVLYKSEEINQALQGQLKYVRK